MKNNVKIIIFYVVLIAAIFFAIYAMMGSPKGKENLKTYQRGKIEYQKLDKQQPSHKQQ